MLVPGEIIRPHAGIAVLISDLTSEGCDFVAEAGIPAAEREWSLWIGAVGPIPITVTGRKEWSFHANFAEELDKRIVRHFNCTIRAEPDTIAA